MATHDLDDDLDPEGPSPEDIARFGADDDADDLSVTCPACGAGVYLDLTACPRCGADMGGARPARVGRIPSWVVKGAVVLVILAMLAWLL